MKAILSFLALVLLIPVFYIVRFAVDKTLEHMQTKNNKNI